MNKLEKHLIAIIEAVISSALESGLDSFAISIQRSLCSALVEGRGDLNDLKVKERKCHCERCSFCMSNEEEGE